MMSEAAPEAGWDMKKLMNNGLLLLLPIEDVEALRDHLYHIAGPGPEGELPEAGKPMDTSHGPGRLRPPATHA